MSPTLYLAYISQVLIDFGYACCATRGLHPLALTLILTPALALALALALILTLALTVALTLALLLPLALTLTRPQGARWLPRVRGARGAPSGPGLGLGLGLG